MHFYKWSDPQPSWKYCKYLYLRDELVEAYGYDIRGEDNAPRARRRRRYGRGPNKYTRNWEDEDAYGKPVGPANPKAGGRGGGQQRTQVCRGDVYIVDILWPPSPTIFIGMF